MKHQWAVEEETDSMNIPDLPSSLTDMTNALMVTVKKTLAEVMTVMLNSFFLSSVTLLEFCA